MPEEGIDVIVGVDTTPTRNQRSRSTNTVADVIDGVTITLKKGSGSTDLSLDFDKNITQNRVQALLDSYNDVIHAIDAQTTAQKSADGRLPSLAATAVSSGDGNALSLQADKINKKKVRLIIGW